MQRGKSENENYYYFLDNKIKTEYNLLLRTNPNNEWRQAEEMPFKKILIYW